MSGVSMAVRGQVCHLLSYNIYRFKSCHRQTSIKNY